MEGEVVIPIDLDTKRFDRQIDAVERQLNDLIADYDTMSKEKGFKEDSQDAIELRKNIEKLQNKLVDLNQQKEKWNKQNLKGIDLSGIGNATENIIRKVLKWGLALFSIRSAYNFIRGSVSLLAQSNEQIGADVEYIRWALASTLQPIIETIIKLAYTLLQYINYIANAWFGVNLFAKASSKSFEKVNKSVKGTNKEAKELQKTIAGFDKMNILQKNGSVASGGGGGGVALPSTDLSQMLGEAEIPEWVEWIAENGNTIRDIIIGIAQAFATWKVLTWVNELGLFAKGIDLLGRTLQGVGIALIIIGIWKAVGDLIELIVNPSWDNFHKLIADLSLALEGLGLVLLGINASNPFGWVTLGIGVVGQLISVFDGLLGSTKDETKALEDSATATENLKKAKDNLSKTSSEYTKAVNNSRDATQKLKDLEEKHKLSGEALFNAIKIGTKDVTNLTDEEFAVYQAYLDNIDAQKNLKDKTIDLNKSQQDLRANTAKLSGAIYEEKGAYDASFKAIIEGFDGTKESAERTREYIFAMLVNMDKETRKTFIETLPPSIAEAFNTPKNMIRILADGTEIAYRDIYNATKQTFTKDIPNSITNTNKSMDLFKDKLSSAYNLIKKFPGLNIKASFSSSGSYPQAKGGIVTKLATGGIVNRPGRGVPVSSSYMGEAGREGILPLTDSQAMETLGQAIGRYISINATIPVYAYNRQIAREVRKIQADDDFAFNGG